MEPLLKADIFFFITSVAVIICTIVFVIAGYYVIKTMKNISRISESLKNTVESAESELADMSAHVRDSALFTFIFGKRKKAK
jgi:uncharacterized protein YoxC